MLRLEHWPIDRLIPYGRNPRKNDDAVDKMAGAIQEFGFRIPVLAKSDGTVVDGHLRLKAAKKLPKTAALQVPEQIVKSRERFQRHQRRTQAQVRALGTQHPFWNNANPAIGSLAIDALPITVFASPPNRHHESKERMPTVVHRDGFQIVCIM